VNVRRALTDLTMVASHAMRVWRSGQARFRLETFGLYYPSLPYERRAWQVDVRVLFMFLRRAPAYFRWVIEMEQLRSEGPRSWWERRGGRRHAK
jgi:hypothetical protein